MRRIIGSGTKAEMIDDRGKRSLQPQKCLDGYLVHFACIIITNNNCLDHKSKHPSRSHLSLSSRSLLYTVSLFNLALSHAKKDLVLHVCIILYLCMEDIIFIIRSMLYSTNSELQGSYCTVLYFVLR